MKAGETKDQWLQNIKPQTQNVPQVDLSQIKPVSFIQTPTLDPSQIKINVPTQSPNFNRSQVRDIMRSRRLNPYQFTGSQRRALRNVMNELGTEEDKAIVKSMGILKQGGNLLPSRNIVERFKSQRNIKS